MIITERVCLFLAVLHIVVAAAFAFGPFKSIGAVIPSKSGSISSKQQVTDLKSQLVKLCTGTSNGVKSTLDTQEQVAGLVQDLTKFNRVQLSPKSNDAMNGRWKLLYTTNREFSAGKVGPFVGVVVQTIDLKAVNYVNDLKLGNGIFRAQLLGTFENLPKNSWKVIFKSVSITLLGVKVLDKALPGEGLWQLLYLDENFRVFYANNFKTPEKKNLYIMQRV